MKIWRLLPPIPTVGAVAVGVLGIGATIYVNGPLRTPGPGGDRASLPSQHGANDEMVGRLRDYARSVGAGEPAATPEKMLPDVNTMIDRLATRLEAAPGDVKGWRMLGWSYFHTARYKEAAAAYARAVELDPSSDGLKASYEEAKAKAAGSETSELGVQAQAGVRSEAAGGAGVAPNRGLEAMPAQERGAAIRAMVDGLADRLSNAPRDVDGWTRLMRSRVVLGEREIAVTELRKALDVFKDDASASGRLTAAATELGLKAE